MSQRLSLVLPWIAAMLSMLRGLWRSGAWPRGELTRVCVSTAGGGYTERGDELSEQNQQQERGRGTSRMGERERVWEVR